jgi:Flp pilus assembly protein TadG
MDCQEHQETDGKISTGSCASSDAKRYGMHLFAKRFGADKRGATAVEFGLLATPFFFMLMMIVEMSMVFWTRQVLQEATNQAARTVLTGESRTLYTGSAAAQTAAFRDAVCARMNIATDCPTRLFIDVQPSSAFPANADSMVTSGTIDVTRYQMRPVAPSEIVVVRTAFKVPVITSGFFSAMSRLTTNENVLESVVAFRAEPFPTT